MSTTDAVPVGPPSHSSDQKDRHLSLTIKKNKDFFFQIIGPLSTKRINKYFTKTRNDKKETITLSKKKATGFSTSISRRIQPKRY